MAKIIKTGQEEFQSNHDVNMFIEDMFESEKAGRYIYEKCTPDHEAMNIYVDLKKKLDLFKKQGLCDYHMDNGGICYEIHFVRVKWKSEAEVRIDKLIDMLKPFILLKENESQYVMFRDGNEMLFSFVLYQP